jgi:hemerythrin
MGVAQTGGRSMSAKKSAAPFLPVWKDEYLTGIAAIDEQHRHFFDVVGDLLQKAGRADLTRADQEAALEELINYACYHFSTEEEWMQGHSYPAKEYRTHCREHALFVDDVKKLRTRMYSGDDIFADMLGFASQWLVKHITKTDVKYAQFERAKKKGSSD